MEILIVILLAIVGWALLLGITYVTSAFLIYVAQEANHEFRKMKRSFRNALWDLEWKLKHR